MEFMQGVVSVCDGYDLGALCGGRPLSMMWCPDGIGQGLLGLGMAVCSGEREFPPKKGEEESLCIAPLREKAEESLR